MTTNQEPTPEAGAAEGSRLPVPTARPAYPVRPDLRPPSRLETVVARVRPALPVIARSAAVAVTVTAGALVAAKAGPRVLRRSTGTPLPRPWLPVSSDVPGGIAAAASRATPEAVVVSRTYVSVTRVEVHRYLTQR